MAEYLICTLRGRNLWNGGGINFKGESPCNSFIPDTEEEVRTTFGSLLVVDPSVQQGWKGGLRGELVEIFCSLALKAIMM